MNATRKEVWDEVWDRFLLIFLLWSTFSGFLWTALPAAFLAAFQWRHVSIKYGSRSRSDS